MKLFYVIIFIVASIFIARLFNVQVVKGNEYVSKADGQYVVSSGKIFNRGNIFFTERGGGRVSAAALRTGFIIAINPSRLADPKDTFEKLSKFIDIDSDIFFIRASKKNDPYEEIARRVPEEVAENIKTLKIDGVIVSKDRWRFYPAEEMASHVLGFVGYKEDKLSGMYGLERYYDDVLERDEENLYVNFFAEIFSNISGSIFRETHREGDIITSIEPSVQGVLESKLSLVMDRWDTELTGGVIIDPVSGSVYAMANFPSFNPNTFNTISDQSVFKNPIVESVFEMGSIIKPLTVAFGIDSGAIKADTEYVDYGYVLLNGRRIGNFDGKARGKVSMQEVLDQSLNTGAMFVVDKIGKEKFKEYILEFGIDDYTGIDLPGEILGLVGNLNSNRDVEFATASFGQGIAITPIATVRALSVLANGGNLITPHIAEEIDYRTGFSRNMSPADKKRVLKEETSEEITRMLVSVVDNALAGGNVELPNHSVAAKTGTAQIARPEAGGYYDNKFLHSFFGYFPAYNPKFLVFLYAVDPKNVQYASQTLTDPFMDITKFLISYYDIPPDR